MEMETSGIYSGEKAWVINALSVNAILAQRNTNQFSTNPAGIVKQMIEYVFSRLVLENFSSCKWKLIQLQHFHQNQIHTCIFAYAFGI